MKKSKVITVAGAAALIGAIGIGSTLAYFTDSEEASNVVTMGHVDISLDEPVFAAENDNNTISRVVPNQTITKDPTITVGEDSEDCYLRAAIAFEGLTEEQEADILENINVDSDKWVLQEDGYYYYQDIAEAGEEVKLFTEVTIPAKWGNELADSDFKINISAEAIQADNFEPETDGDVITGWQGITAESYEDVNASVEE